MDIYYTLAKLVCKGVDTWYINKEEEKEEGEEEKVMEEEGDGRERKKRRRCRKRRKRKQHWAVAGSKTSGELEFG